MTMHTSTPFFTPNCTQSARGQRHVQTRVHYTRRARGWSRLGLRLEGGGGRGGAPAVYHSNTGDAAEGSHPRQVWRGCRAAQQHANTARFIVQRQVQRAQTQAKIRGTHTTAPPPFPPRTYLHCRRRPPPHRRWASQWDHRHWRPSHQARRHLQPPPWPAARRGGTWPALQAAAFAAASAGCHPVCEAQAAHTCPTQDTHACAVHTRTAPPPRTHFWVRWRGGKSRHGGKVSLPQDGRTTH
jgi:hypothetical protein